MRTLLRALVSFVLFCSAAWAGVTHQKGFVQQHTSANGLTDTFTANANATNDAIVIGVLCGNSSGSAPTVTLTAPGWSFTQLGIVNETVYLKGNAYWTALFGAIAPNTSSATFTVTWTASSNCNALGELGDEFSGNDTTGGTVTFDNTAQTGVTNAFCSVNLATGNADDAVWGACWGTSVTAVGSGYTQGANDGNGDWTEYKITSDSADTWETVNFIPSGNGVFNAAAVTIKPAPPSGTPPIINSLSPPFGAVGSMIVINGNNFGATQGSSTVKFNGTAATVSSWSATSIMATVPSSATTGSVVVTVNGVVSNPVTFTVISTISHIKAFVQHSGSTDGLDIMTDTFTAAASAPNDAVLVAVYCANGGIAASNVTLTAPGWTGNNAFQLLGSIGTGSTSSMAVFGAIAPNTTPAAFTVTWTDSANCTSFRESGDEFAGTDTTGGNTTFDCGGKNCSGGSNNAHSTSGSCSVSVTTESANEAIWAACAPSTSVTASGSGYSVGAIDGIGGETEFKVTTDSAGKAETAGFASTTSYNAVAATIKPVASGTPPTITSLSPMSAAVGTSVTIDGSGFGSTQGTSILLLGGLTVTPNIWASGSITFTVPSTATTSNVVVKVGGRASNAVLFTVNPNISSLSPSADLVGTSVTISGSGFGPSEGNSTVTFNGTPATVTSWSSSANSITATVPAGATSGNVIVTVAGVASNGVNFTVLASPSITSLSPTSGFVATPVTITGNNFGGAQGAVSFNGVTATITSWTNTVITTTVPAGATTGNVVVTAALGGTPSNSEEFTVLGIRHQQAFVQQQKNTSSLTDTFTAAASAANDAVLVGVLCNNGGSSTPSDVSLTAPGWTFTRLGAIGGPNYWSAVFGAIAPNTNSTTFTVTWTATANCTFMGELGDEFSGNDTTGGTTTFDNTAQNSAFGTCTVNLTTGNADDAVWGACWANPVTAVGLGYTQGANDGAGDWSEYKNTTDGAGTWETVNLASTPGVFNEVAVTIKPGVPSSTAPSIANLSPNIGAVGSMIVIAGTNFGSSQGSSTVTFNGGNATVISWSTTSITVTVPSGATTGSVLVTVGGIASNPALFTVLSGATHLKAFVQQSKQASTLTDTFTAAASAPNDAVVVAVYCANNGTASNVTLSAPGWTGANAFQRLGNIGNGGGSAIAVFGAIAPNTTPATFTVTWTDTANCTFLGEMGDEFAGADATGGSTTFDCTGPCAGGSNNAHSTSGSCSVNVTTGSANEAVWAACVPSNWVTALGSGYTLGTIDGGGSEAEYKTTTSAAGTAETASFTSTTSYNSIGLTIKPFSGSVAPGITGLGPNSGQVGTSVTIRGTGFGTAQGTSTVLLSGVAATPTSWGSTSITFPVPSGATTGNVVVIVGGLASNAVPFTVVPTISGLTPGSGLIGSSVTVSGTGFGALQGTSTVIFNGTVATVTSWNTNSITATVPTGATTGSVVVEVDGILSNGMAFTVTPTSGTTSLVPANVSVGFADSSSASLNFPTPWEGSPNVVFIGKSTPPGAGAIRIDNPTSSPISIDSVTVDLQRPTAQFSLWGSFTIPANGSAILTQTQPGNFDTSAFPIVPCGGTLSANETRIPRITITIAGTPQNFMDTAHVLDTGGFDLACRGNESLQWRGIATTGIANPMGQLTLTPATTTLSGGSPVTITAQLNDASGVGLANVTVDFKALSGPNAGQNGEVITNNQGQAQFVYTGSNLGTDVLQASVKNASNGVFQSSQVTVTWQTASCSPSSSAQNGTPSLVYIGATAAEFNDNFEMAALLTDSAGTPAPGRSITFLLRGQSFSATTDSTGVARVITVINSAPGTMPLSASFPGDSALPPLQASQNININLEETRIRYIGNTLLGNSTAQTVSAVLLDPQSLSPVANKTLTFTVGGVTASAVTNTNGVATASVTLGNQLNGPSSIIVNFAGDEFYKPSVRTMPVIVYFPVGFVIWGGNPNGLKIGQTVNFWGSQWESQITGGPYGQVSPAFKGWSGLTSPVQQCQPNATPGNLTMACWQVKPGQSFPPNETLPNFIEVVVSTVIDKTGDTVFGNIACGAVVQVNHTPPYGGVPGQPGFGTIAAVDGNCGAVFPAPAMVTATQTQPATVLPNQTVTVTTTVNNSSTATSATNVTVSETFDGLTPATASATLGDTPANGSVSATFEATVPAIPIRGALETPTQYIQRLSALNGRIFTATGSVTFTDAEEQNYLPVDVFSESVLNIPIIDLAVSGPAVVEPGSPATFLVTASNIGSAPASSVQIVVTKPDHTTVTLTAATIVPGSSFSQPVTFTPAAISPIQPGETTAQYLARLALADGQILQTSADVNWNDTASNTYGDVGQQIFSSSLRVPILQLTPPPAANLLPSQNASLVFNVTNSGGCTAITSNLQATNPDSSTATAPAFPLAAGQNTTATTTWHVTAVAPRSTTETDSAYQTRLMTLNNSPLNFSDSLSWTDPASTSYGPTTGTFSLTEVVPIVTVALTAPANAQAGTTITYGLTLTNIGGTSSPAPNLIVTMPDSSVQTPAVGALNPNGTFSTSINYTIPTTQPTGNISASAVVKWNDSGLNAYGPLTSTATTGVTNPTSFNSLVLAPAIAGPDVTGTTQTLTATLKDPSSNPIANATVQFTVTGTNPTSGSATTNASGVATFSYSGALTGNDTVQATSGTAVSNKATVSWITPIQNVSTSTVFGRFFTSDGSGAFNISPTTPPAFTQEFPTINFNPPAGTIPGNTSNVGIGTRPFTDVTTDLHGNFTGTIVAQGNGFQAGSNSMFTFQAVFTSTFTVSSAGNVVFNFFSDDAFILGIGGGATRASGPQTNTPAVTPFESLPVMGGVNTPLAATGNTVVVNFPAAGTYPYEVDYTECCGGALVLTMAVGQTNSQGTPPTGSLVLSPNNPPPLNTGQTQTLSVLASDAAGNPVTNTSVALLINGSNPQQLNSTTNSSGVATFKYRGVSAGTDSLQAVADISGLGSFSNQVNMTWTPGGGSTVVTNQGWIGSPISGTQVQGQIPITVASGITLSSGTLEYWPISNPSNVTVLNSNTTGNGTLATFDPTTLANGGYVLQLQATGNGTQQTSLITLTVFSGNKPGRVVFTETDLKLQLAGMPIVIGRTYDSLNRTKSGDFGFGWSLSTSVDLQVDAANNVSFTISGQRRTFFFQPQPSSFFFPWLLNPNYVPEPGLFGSLTESGGCGGGGLMEVQGTVTCFGPGQYQPTSYTYTDPIGRKIAMASSGQIQSITDLNNNVLTFGPNGITSSLNGGVTIPFVRDSQQRITQISDLSSPVNNYVYSYDGSGNLSSVTYPGISTPAQYTYDSTHFLQAETDPAGNLTQTQYDANGRVQSITSQIDPNDSSTKVTTSFKYTLNADGTMTTTTTFPDGGIQVRTDNNFGNPVSIVDPLQRRTSFTYDSQQNVQTMTDALGKITKYTYLNGFQTSVTDPLLHTTSKTYNQFGGVLTSQDALKSNTTTITYDNNFNPITWTDLQSQTPFRQATYNPDGTLNSLTDGNLNPATSYQYDSFGNLAEIDAPLGQTTKITYDPMERVATVLDPRQKQTTFKYDPLGRVSDRIDQDTGDTQYTYDGNNNLKSMTDALKNPPTTYQYDGLNHLTKITYPDATTRQFTNDFRGNKLKETDQLGHVTQYAYDLAGQLTSVTYVVGTPDQATVVYTYDLDGRKKTETDGRGNITTYNYDDAGRLGSVVDALKNPTTYGYDADNRRKSVLDANQHNTSYGYDLRGRLQTITYNDLTTTQYTYDNNNNQKTITDQAGNITTKNYDVLNRLSSVVDAMSPGQTTSYTYDGDNNLASVTDANQHITTFQYDDLNRRNLRVLPINTISESMVYDADGNLSSHTDFNGKTTTYTYDSMNRLLSKTPDPTLNEPTVSFTYTATGKRKTMTDATGATTYSYDNRDRLQSKVTPQGTLSYTYDGANNVLSITSSNTNGASLSYSYDADDRLSTAIDNTLQAQGLPGGTTYSYDPAGNLSSYTYPITLRSSYTYDTLNRLTNMQSSCGTAASGCAAPDKPLASFAYTLGPAGNRKNVTELGGRSVTYGYDNDYRLTSEAITGDVSQNGTVSYSYDPVGNRTQLSSTVPAIPSSGTLTYDANDRSLPDSYDNNGNLLNSGTGTNVYDFENKLIKDGTVTVVYDGDGNRVSETAGSVTTKYLMDTVNPTGYSQVVDELVSGSVTRTYSYGLQRISENQLSSGTWTPSFYGYDGHGSVRFLTNANASVTDTYEYDAFGNLIASTGSTPNNYLFAGEQFDPALGIYQMRARWYRQATGRFNTRDRYEGDIEKPATLHKYVYVANNPVNFVDPTGDEGVLTYAVLATYIVKRTAPIAHQIGECINQAYTSEALVFGAVVNGYATDVSTPGKIIAYNLGVCYLGAARGLLRPNPLPYLIAPSLPPWLRPLIPTPLLPNPLPPWFPFPIPAPIPLGGGGGTGAF